MVNKNTKRKKSAVLAAPTKLDLGCGPNKQPGFHGVDCLAFDGVDTIHDLRTTPWPFESASIDTVHCSHFVEHLTGKERIAFFNELYRVMKIGGTATIIVPHWSNACAYGDPTHQWPPMSEWAVFYLDKHWRAANAPHVDYTCDYEYVAGFAFDERVGLWNNERKTFALAHHLNAARDMHWTLKKR